MQNGMLDRYFREINGWPKDKATAAAAKAKVEEALAIHERMKKCEALGKVLRRVEFRLAAGQLDEALKELEAAIAEAKK